MSIRYLAVTTLLNAITMLAVSDRDAALSLLGQVGSMAVAFYIARYMTRSRAIILLVSVLGGGAAMLAHILVDGQGACALLGAVPVIYLTAVTGRRDLRTL